MNDETEQRGMAILQQYTTEEVTAFLAGAHSVRDAIENFCGNCLRGMTAIELRDHLLKSVDGGLMTLQEMALRAGKDIL